MFDYSFHWRSAFKALPDMLAGAWVTLETAALSMLLGTLIALLLTVMRQMQHPVPRHFANTWVSIARNTPSLFQIYILYFGLGSFGLHVSSGSPWSRGSPSTMPATWRRTSAAASRRCRRRR